LLTRVTIVQPSGKVVEIRIKVIVGLKHAI
jgi:hypothetical protein